MSGGGSSKKKSSKKKDEPAMTPGPTVPAFMPGMDNMLAQQLSAGGYGDQNDLLSYFQQIYSPMTMPGSNVVQGGSSSGGSSSIDGGPDGGNGWVHNGGTKSTLWRHGYPVWSFDPFGRV